MTQQTPAIFPNTGLASYGEASPEYELAPIGIASMPEQVKRLAEFGRNGDIYVIHAAQGETVIPMEVLDANPQIKALLFNQMAEMGLDPQRYVVGDQLNSLNPVTGMPEFFFSSIFKSIKKAVKSVVKVVKKVAPIALPLIAAFAGFPFLLPATNIFAAGSMASMALASGIGTLVSGGNLKDAFKSALISGGTAGIFGGLKGLAGAPPGTGLKGFGAGFKAAATGQAPIFDAAGKLIGYQAPATFSERITDIKQGNWADAITGEGGTFTPEGIHIGPGGGISIDPITGLPRGIGATQYVKGLPSGDTSTTLGAQSILQGGPSQVTSGVTPGQEFFSRTWPNAPVPGPSTTMPMPTGAAQTPGMLDLFTPPTDAPVAYSPDLAGATGNTVLAQAGTGEDYLTKAVDWGKRGGLTTQEIASNVADAEATYIAKMKSLGVAPSEAGLKAAAASAQPGTLAKWGPTVAAAGLGAYGLGAFDVAEGDTDEEIRETSEAALAGRRGIDLDLAKEQQLAEASLNPFLFAPQTSYTSLLAARGGSVNFPERDLLVEGPGTEKSDEIPAMLSDGEFVINSKAVRGADPSGRGNRYAGAQNLYNLMRNFEMRA